MDLFYFKQVIEGNVSGFSYFIEKYKDMAYSIAFRIINNKEDAEEVVQDSFVKAYRSLKTFRQDAKFSTWFYKIVVNTSLSKIRKKKFEALDIDVDEMGETIGDGVESAYNNLASADRKKFINLALEELLMEERLLLTLYYLGENSIDEIGEITGIKAANIKMKLHRARKKMLAILEKTLKSELQYIV